MASNSAASTYPDSRTLVPVQHRELHPSLVYYPAGKAIESVNLAYNRSLPDAAEAGVAGADAQVVERRCDQRRPRARPRRRGARFRAGMPAAYHDNVEAAP